MKTNQLIGRERTVSYGPLIGAIVKVESENEDGSFSCVLTEDFKCYESGDGVVLEK